MEDKIILTADDGTDVTFYVIEETRLGASNYLLVADSDDEDAECLILKDTSRENSFLMRILPLSDAQKM